MTRLRPPPWVVIREPRSGSNDLLLSSTRLRFGVRGLIVTFRFGFGRSSYRLVQAYSEAQVRLVLCGTFQTRRYRAPGITSHSQMRLRELTSYPQMTTSMLISAPTS